MFGSNNNNPFAQSSSSPFGSPSLFGVTSSPITNPFGSSSFGDSNPFGAQTVSSIFGGTSTGVFGQSSTPAFGASSSPAFGSTTPAFGVTSTPAFGAAASSFGSAQTTTPSFGSPGFGQTGLGTTRVGTRVVPHSATCETDAGGTTPTGKLESISAMPAYNGKCHEELRWEDYQRGDKGAQTTTPAFGSPCFGQTGLGTIRAGTRVVPHSATRETDAGGTTPTGKLESISAMPAYNGKCHEELRWEDYQRGDKGGPNQTGQSASANQFGSTNSTFSQPAATTNSFSATISSNPFASKTPAFCSSPFGISSSSPFGSTFGASSSNPFGSTTSTPSLFGTTSNTAFSSASSPSLFGGTANTLDSSSLFRSTSGTTSTFYSGLNFGNTQTSGLFQSSSPSLGQSVSPFGEATGFQQAPSAFGSTPSAFGSNPFGTQSTGFGGSVFSSSASMFSTSNPIGFGQTTPSLSNIFQSAPAQSSGVFSFNNFGQAQQAPSTGFGGTSNISTPGTFGQGASPQPNMVMQPAPSITNPFGTLPSVPQMSTGHVGSAASSVHYGISSMPVTEKPQPTRICSLLFPGHISQRKISLPTRKYHPKVDGERVPFFSDDDASTSTPPKADDLFIPRENPRSLLLRPAEQCSSVHSKHHMETSDILKDSLFSGNGKLSREPSDPVLDESSQDYHDGSPNENSYGKENHAYPSSLLPTKSTTNANGSVKDSNNSPYLKKVSVLHAGIEALMPKLYHSDYYTEPHIQELAAKERAELGSCRRVKDFTVGRHGYGSIKFFGETDVRGLDLETIVQFNDREVIVYGDESKKPGIGQGLNKPAEVTLLNVKCVNKKTGEQYVDGPKVEKYKEMLIKKAEEQGAEFVSFDPSKGEWKFRVDHFSSYEFGDGHGCVCFL